MWVGWPISRILLLLLAVIFSGIFVQVTMFHYRQNFRHWAQWVPVLATPVLALVSLVLAFFLTPGWVWAGAVLYSAGAAAGVGGTVLHFTGVGERVGGYNVQNFLVGPPVVLPMMVLLMSILGLVALYWRG